MEKILLSPLLQKGIIENNLLAASSAPGPETNVETEEIDLDTFLTDEPLPQPKAKVVQEQKEKVFEKRYIPKEERVPEMEFSQGENAPISPDEIFSKEELRKKAKDSTEWITDVVCNVIPSVSYVAVRIDEGSIADKVEQKLISPNTLKRVEAQNKRNKEALQVQDWIRNSLDKSLFELAEVKGESMQIPPNTRLWGTILIFVIMYAFSIYSMREDNKRTLREVEAEAAQNKKEREENEKIAAKA